MPNHHITLETTKENTDKKLSSAQKTEAKNNHLAFISAARRSEQERVRMLIKAGANPNIADQSGKTAIDYAIDNKNLFIIRLLLISGAQINDQEKFLNLLLNYSIDQSSSNVTKSQKGFFSFLSNLIGQRSSNITTSDNLKIAYELLKSNYCNLNYLNQYGDTALLIATRLNKQERARVLIEAGANPNIADRHGKTALDHAIDNRNIYISRLLAHDQKARIKNPKEFFTILKASDQRDPNVFLCLTALNLHQENLCALLGTLQNNRSHEEKFTLLDKKDHEEISNTFREFNKLNLIFSMFVFAEVYESTLSINNSHGMPEIILDIIMKYDGPIEGNRIRSFKENEALHFDGKLTDYDYHLTKQRGETALIIAARLNKQGRVDTLIKAGVIDSIYRTDKHGNSALDYAIDNKNLFLIRLLSEVTSYRSQIKNPKEFINLLLSYIEQFSTKVTESDKLKITYKLIESYAVYLDYPDQYGETALITAARLNQQERVRILVEAKADPNTIYDYGYRLSYSVKDFLLCIKDGYRKPFVNNKKINYSTSLDLFFHDKMDLGFLIHETDNKYPLIYKDLNKKTALYYALNNKNIFIIRLLLNHNAQIIALENSLDILLSFFDNPNSNTTKPDELKIVSELIKSKEYLLNHKNQDGDTALIKAARLNQQERVRILIEAGADPEIANKKNHTALYYAIHNKNILITGLLRRHGSLDNGPNNIAIILFSFFDESKPHIIESDYLSFIRELINLHHPSIKDQYLNYYGAGLILAICNNRKKYVRALFEAGINLNLTDFYQEQALDFAVENKNIYIARLLVAQDQKIQIRNPKKLFNLLKTSDQRDPNVLACLAGLHANQENSRKQELIIKEYSCYKSEFGLLDEKDYKEMHNNFTSLSKLNCLLLTLVFAELDASIPSLKKGYLDRYHKTILDIIMAYDDPIEGNRIRFFETNEILSSDEVETLTIYRNITDKHEETTLIATTRLNKQESIPALIQAGVNIHSIDKHGNTALDYAIDNKNLFIVRLLLTHGARIRNQEKLLDFLLSFFDKPKLNVTTSDVITSDESEIAYELIKLHCHLDQRNLNDDTPLITAIRLNQQERVRILLEAGANPNLANRYTIIKTPNHSYHHTPCNRNIPLYYALDSKNIFITNLLLNHKAQIIDPDCFLYRLLRLFDEPNAHTIQSYCIAFMRDLVRSNRFDPNHRNPYGRTALIEAAHHNKREHVRVLIEIGADLNLTDREGKTALDYTIDHYRLFITHLLLTHGAQIKDPKKFLNSFLVSVENACYLDITESNNLKNCYDLIKSKNCKFAHQQAENDYKALISAIDCNQQEHARVLIEAGASLNPNIDDNPKRTALNHAINNKNNYVVRLLIAHNYKNPIGNLQAFFTFLKVSDQRDPNILICLDNLRMNQIHLNNRLPPQTNNWSKEKFALLDEKDYKEMNNHFNNLNRLRWAFSTLVFAQLNACIPSLKPDQSTFTFIPSSTKHGSEKPKTILDIIVEYDGPIEGDRIRFFKPNETLNYNEVESLSDRHMHKVKAEFYSGTEKRRGLFIFSANMNSDILTEELKHMEKNHRK